MSSLTLFSGISAYYASLSWKPRFAAGSRTARRVVSAADHEVWLMAWLPGQGTELHDHGGSHRPAEAGFTVVSGRLREYTVVPGFFPGLSSRAVAAGESAAVSPRTVHAVRNDGDEPAVSVHVYAPRLEMMRSYWFDETGLSLGSVRRAGADW